MKTKITIFLLSIVIFSIYSTNTIIAQGLNIPVGQEKFGQKWQEVKTTISEKRQENQERRQERRAERAHIHAERLQNRFANHYNHLSQMIEKIQNRLNIMAENGNDISSAQAYLNQASTKLQEAKTTGEQAVSLFYAIQEETWKEQKEDMQNAKNLAKQTRQLFVDALRLMRQAVINAKSANI